MKKLLTTLILSLLVILSLTSATSTSDTSSARDTRIENYQTQTIYRNAFFFYNGRKIDIRISCETYNTREYGTVTKLSEYFYSVYFGINLE